MWRRQVGVSAFDFFANLIALAKGRKTAHFSRITYQVVEATDETAEPDLVRNSVAKFHFQLF
jgi:hypothetical protein